MAKCVELVAVYDDGTVVRWEAPDLAGGLPPLRFCDRAKPRQYMDEDGEPYNWPDTVEPTTTHPMRKVTVVRGRACINGNARHVIVEWNGHARRNIHTDRILPLALFSDERAGDLCDFRITVEAVPAKEG